MLDIIKNSRILDLADNLWCDQIRNGFLVSMLDNKSTEIVSALEKRAKSVTKTLEKAIEGFNNSGN